MKKRPDRRTEGRKDRQTLFYRALPATAGGPKRRCLLFNSFNLYEPKKINVNAKSFVDLVLPQQVFR